MKELINEIEVAMSVHVMSDELLPKTRAQVDAMLRTYGRDQTLAAMRSLVEAFAADEERSEPSGSSGIADMIYIAAHFRLVYLKLSIEYVESLPRGR